MISNGMICILFALLGVSTLLQAADVTGSINGVVKDASGAVAPGIEITVTNTATSAIFHTKTDSSGEDFVRDLGAGAYELTVQAPGFKKFSASNIRVQVNEAARVDIDLQVGSVDQTVDVSGSVETVDTTSMTLKTVIDQQRIEDLPLNGRNPVQLMQLVAGVQYDPQNSNVTSEPPIPASSLSQSMEAATTPPTTSSTARKITTITATRPIPCRIPMRCKSSVCRPTHSTRNMAATSAPL